MSTPFVPVEALTSPRDRFACAPLSATLPAESCVARQRLSRYGGRRGQALIPVGWFPSCERCAVGERVAAAVGLAITAEDGTTRAPCVTPGCRRLASPRRTKYARLAGLCVECRAASYYDPPPCATAGCGRPRSTRGPEHGPLAGLCGRCLRAARRAATRAA